MIDTKEHIYDDDPNQGHPDVRTRLKDVSYFFLGNGLIQAAVQFAPSGEGTPVGLLIMNPEKLRKKRESLTFDAETGLENTLIRITARGESGDLTMGNVTSKWLHDAGVPTVEIEWMAGDIDVAERFFCPDLEFARLIRQIRFHNPSNQAIEFKLRTGIKKQMLKRDISLQPSHTESVFLEYSLDSRTDKVTVELTTLQEPDGETLNYWANQALVDFGHPLLNHFFKASTVQMPAVISSQGRVDASIWQYNREWARDQSFLALALTMSGHFAAARRILERLIRDFVTDDGDTVDSSERRHTDEVELDQNGVLLYALETYVNWTGDLDLVRENWEKIRITTEFPLREVFRHQPSGLLQNVREYWERHASHGIQRGFDVIYQVFTVIGLNSASSLARRLSHGKLADHWAKTAAELKYAILYHPQYALIDERGFIKRRLVDGSSQEMITPREDSRLPDGAPLSAPGDHLLNPDASTALPISFGFVPPDGEVATATLKSLESLWNQDWDYGGYGRYHFTSEPDSPGGWPFPSLFIARAYLETGDYDKVWRVLNWLNTVAGSTAASWFEFYGPRLAPPFPQVGIIPWTWAEMVILFVHHILGIRPGENELRFRPRFLPGIDHVSGSLPLRDKRLYFIINTDASHVTPVFEVNGRKMEAVGHQIAGKGEKPVKFWEIALPYSDEDIRVDCVLPSVE